MKLQEEKRRRAALIRAAESTLEQPHPSWRPEEARTNRLEALRFLVTEVDAECEGLRLYIKDWQTDLIAKSRRLERLRAQLTAEESGTASNPPIPPA
jgi:uncharacterized protein YlxW (UPF0749 family)